MQKLNIINIIICKQFFILIKIKFVKNLIKIFYIILSIFSLSSCKIYNLKKINSFNLIDNNTNLSIKVNGIECEFCAKSAIDSILSIDGIRDAKFEDFSQDYSCINLTISDKYIDQDSREKLIIELEKELKKNDFNLEK